MRNGAESLFLRPMDHFTPDLVEGTSGARTPFFSRDGRAIGFVGGSSVKKVSLPDLAVATVCKLSGANPEGASWENDGAVLLGSSDAGLRRCRSNGSLEDLTRLETAMGEAGHRWPDVLPNGKAVLFTIYSTAPSQLGVLSLESGKVVHLNIQGSQPRYVQTGHVIFTRNEDLWAVPFQMNTLTDESRAFRARDGKSGSGAERLRRFLCRRPMRRR